MRLWGQAAKQACPPVCLLVQLSSSDSVSWRDRVCPSAMVTPPTSIYRFYHYSLNLYALYFEWSTWVVLVYYKNSSWSLGLWARYEPCLGVNISCPIKWNLNWCLYSWQFFLFFNELFSTISKKMSSLLHLEWLCGLFEYIWRWFFSFFFETDDDFFMQYKICKWRIPSTATVVYTYSLSLYKYFHLLNTRISRAQPAENFLTISIQPKTKAFPLTIQIRNRRHQLQKTRKIKVLFDS